VSTRSHTDRHSATVVIVDSVNVRQLLIGVQVSLLETSYARLRQVVHTGRMKMQVRKNEVRLSWGGNASINHAGKVMHNISPILPW